MRAPAAERAVHRAGPYRAGSASFSLAGDDADVIALLDSDLRDLRDVRWGAGAPAARPTDLTVTRRRHPSQTHPWDVSVDGEICQTVTERYLRPYVL